MPVQIDWPQDAWPVGSRVQIRGALHFIHSKGLDIPGLDRTAYVEVLSTEAGILRVNRILCHLRGLGLTDELRRGILKMEGRSAARGVMLLTEEQVEIARKAGKAPLMSSIRLKEPFVVGPLHAIVRAAERPFDEPTDLRVGPLAGHRLAVVDARSAAESCNG